VLPREQAIALNTLHGQHGPEKLRAKIRAFLAWPKSEGFRTPKRLAGCWDEVPGSNGLFPDDKWSRIDQKLIAEWQVILGEGKPPEDSDRVMRRRWEGIHETMAKYHVTPEEVLARRGR
jgi:hypothetical protein